MVTLEVSHREVALMRSLARVSQKACERQALVSPRGWERDLYARQAKLHEELADRLEQAVPAAALAYPYDLDYEWDGLE